MAGSAEDEEETLALSGHALTALQEFYSERDVQQQRFEELKSATEASLLDQKLSMDMFAEDWNASQFWYGNETAITLARELLRDASAATSIAVVSAPSVFLQMKNLLPLSSSVNHPQLRLFEYDERFAVLRDFVRYDFNSPINLPLELKGKFDRIICDPPFLNERCQTKTAITVRWLSKPSSSRTAEAQSTRLVVCTGERMESLIHKVYPGVRTTTFEPQHIQGRLGNEFRCYANFECEAWSWR